TNAASAERRAHEHARTSERDDDRARRTTRGAVVNGLDVVAVRIEQKRGVVAGMIRPLPGRTVVTSPGVEPGSVERVDGLSVRCLEREVNAPGELTRRGLRLLAGNEELVCPKPVLALAAERDPQSAENGTIKALARFDVPHDQLHVIQHSPAVKLRRLHERRLPPGPALDTSVRWTLRVATTLRRLDRLDGVSPRHCGKTAPPQRQAP